MAVKAYAPQHHAAHVVIIGAGGAGLRAAIACAEAGLKTVHEGFADRAYTPEGRLVPRSQPGAVIIDAADHLFEGRAQEVGEALEDLLGDF